MPDIYIIDSAISNGIFIGLALIAVAWLIGGLLSRKH